MLELLQNRLVPLGIGLLLLGLGAVAIKRWVAKLSADEASRGTRAVDAAMKKSGDLAAAKVAAEHGLHERAAQLYSKVGRHPEAARELRRAEKWDVAADAFEKLQDWDSAAFCHRRSGDERGLIRTLDRGGHWMEAAQVAEKAGRQIEAADLYVKGGAKAQAVDLLLKAGNKPRAAALRAEVLEEQGNYEGAGKLWAKLDQWDRALEVFLRGELPELAAQTLQHLGRSIEAAELMVECKRPADAANYFEVAQQFRLAAAQWMSAGDPERAIAALQREGDKLGAAKLRMARNEVDKALDLLTSIGDLEAAYPEALRLRGQLLRQRGDAKGAFKAYYSLLSLPGSQPGLLALTQDAVELAIELGQGRIGKALLERAATDFAGRPDLQTWIQDAKRQLAELPDAPEEMGLVSGGSARQSGRVQLASSLEAEAMQTFDEGTFAYVNGEQQVGKADSFGTEIDKDGWPTGVPLSLARRYKGIQRIGQGGNGVVFRAEDALLNRTVVLKFMIDGSMPTAVARKYFEREVKMAASLSHPNIVHIYDMGHDEDVPWYSMEYIEGKPLSAHLPPGRPVADKLFLMSIVEQICAALDHAHSRGMIHRDIKPDNILVSVDGTAKLLDFGLARVLDDSFGELSVLAGTPYYMAPEQIDGSTVDHRADIYALGCILYRAMVGRLPFQDGNIFVAHALEPVPDPLQFNPTLDQRVVALLYRCLAKRPDERPSNCGQIKLELHEALFGSMRPGSATP